MKVRYLGPYETGSVRFEGVEYDVVRGEECEVPDKLGALLLENAEQYETVKKASAKKSADAADQGVTA